MSKIVITGCCGLLGQKLVQKLRKHTIVGFDLLDAYIIPRARISYRNTDISDPDDLQYAVNEYDPDIIVNCAAVTDVDACEKNKALAYMVNVKGAENLVDICLDRDIKLIQISTDYVFDGENGPYSEEDEPNPISYYGVTKHNAEETIMENLKAWMIVRSNVLYGVGVDTQPTFVSWVLEKLQAGKKPSIVTDQYNNPTFVDNLADAVSELIDLNYEGLIHFGGKDYLSRFKFAQAISRAFALEDDLIQPLLTEELQQAAKRPLQCGLKTDRAESMLETKPLSIEEGLEEFKKQLRLQPA
jgi:dTDP-4-dehydrorhamnose reductase